MNSNETPLCQDTQEAPGTEDSQGSTPPEGLTGKASCRLVEPQGCMTRWEGRWELARITGSPEHYSADLSFVGRLLKLSVTLEVAPGRIRLAFPWRNQACYVDSLVDIRRNMGILMPVLGPIEATTVAYCLAGFGRSGAWESLGMNEGGNP